MAEKSMWLQRSEEVMRQGQGRGWEPNQDSFLGSYSRGFSQVAWVLAPRQRMTAFKQQLMVNNE